MRGTATVTVPTALYLFTVWLPHSRHTKTGVPAADLVRALTVVVGLLLHAREGRGGRVREG
ncbi:hypothetical protein P3T27_003748 [Kitasatospora sp. MAA19]|uniref:hypothetical protein n=1 Tax=Kitasatospora sp. MAA19 TaxID=3035090 RepID=UPI0024760D1D|nr:hypothetical protein [Kitasatospora sp. MAA19]MDH6707019.1 hypothetical protein [Kitasatospora sp. MAA19]